MRNVQGFTITVPRLKLLEALRANHEKHLKEYHEALKGYYASCEEALKCRLLLLDGHRARTAEELSQREPHTWLRFEMPCPTCYGDVYEQIISMLEFSEDKTVEIDAEQHRNWVMDEWSWKDGFIATSNRYNKG